MSYVMLVDDEPVLLTAFARILSDAGYEMAAMPSGNSAFAALSAPDARLPDLIITDVLMDGIDGLQLYNAVRQNAAQQHIPFIFVSASAKPELEKMIADSANATFVRKPFDVEKLLAQIADVLGRAAGKG